MSRFIRTISQSASAIAVLSLVCTSVAVASPTATVPTTTTETTATASVAPASSTNATADAEVAQDGPLSDVPEGHWAYDAVAQLVKDGLIKGYPDGLFKGNRPMTRYEAAVLTYRAVDQIEAQITAGKAVAQADIDAVKKLAAAFAKELKDVEAHVAALQTTVDKQGKQISDLKAEADATQLRVNQAKLGFNLIARPGTSSFSVYGQTAAGAPLTPGTTYKYGTGANDSTPAGTYNVGTEYNLARFYLGGQIDPRWSWGARIKSSVTYGPFGTTAVSPSFCNSGTVQTTGQNCTYTDLSYGSSQWGTLPVSLDYANVTYSSPGGLGFQVGRYVAGSYGKFGMAPFGPLLFASNQMTGASLLYNDPAGKIYAAGYYSQPALNNATLNAGTQSFSTTTAIPNSAANIAAGGPATISVVSGANYVTNPCGVVTAGTTATGASAVGTGTVIGLNQGVGGGYKGINPFCSSPQQEFGAWGAYDFQGPKGINGTNVVIGGTVDYIQGKPYTFYDPNAVSCTGVPARLNTTLAASANDCIANGYGVAAASPANKYITGQANVAAIEGYLGAYIGNQFAIALAYDYNITQSPFYSGGTLPGTDAETINFTYASKGNLYAGGGYTNPFQTGGGRKDSNVVGIFGGRFGINSLGNLENTDLAGATGFINNLGLQPAGIEVVGFEAAHWVSSSIRFGINAFHVQQVGGLSGTSGIPTTSGGFVNQINVNQAAAEMYFYFF